MKSPVILAADHAGYSMKEQLSAWLAKLGYPVHDCSPTFRAGDDYPAQAATAARAIRNVPQAKVVLVCGSGAGIAMAANRFSWMRVVQATDPGVIKMARSDEDANGLSLASRKLTLPQAKKLVQVFLSAKPAAGARHKRRQQQLRKLG